MKYTENYHLPQWDESDRIMRTDFNEAMANIEGGLKKTAQDAANGTSQSAASVAAALEEAVSSLTTAVQNAQATADQAVEDAARAQSKADAAYSPDQPPYAIGTYTGTGANQTITVGFRPRFVIISGFFTPAHEYHYAAGENFSNQWFEFTNTGFTVKKYSVAQAGAPSQEQAPFLTSQGRSYAYIAFR